MTAMEIKHQEKLRRWSSIIEECRSSHTSVKQWCTENGITVSTYYRWEREVLSETEKAERSVSPVSFAAIPVPDLPLRNGSECIATVRYGEINLDLYSGIDTKSLSMLLEALRSC